MTQTDDRMSAEEEAAVDALLHALEGGAASPSDVLGVADAWLVVAIVDAGGADVAPLLAGLGEECEAIGGGRWALAINASPAGMAGPDRAVVRRFVDGLRERISGRPGARVAVALDRGSRGAASILGPAPDVAAELFQETAVFGPGLWVCDRIRTAVGEPAEARGPAYRLVWRCSRRRGGTMVWAVAAAAAVLVAIAAPRFMHTPRAPDAKVFVVGERVRGNTFRSGDRIEVTVQADRGAFVTVLLLDSRDRFSLPQPARVNVKHSPVLGAWELDDVPGTEQVVAVVSREPIANVDQLIEQVNDGDDSTRGARIQTLRTALGERLPPGDFNLALGAELVHRP